MLVIHVDGDRLVRLHHPAVLFLHDDPGSRDGHLVAFPAHGLDQDRQVQLAAAGDLEPIRIIGLRHRQRDVV